MNNKEAGNKSFLRFNYVDIDIRCAFDIFTIFVSMSAKVIIVKAFLLSFSLSFLSKVGIMRKKIVKSN